MTKEEAKVKIRKLIAISKSTSSPGEASASLFAARKLAERYGIDMHALAVRNGKKKSSKKKSSGKKKAKAKAKPKKKVAKKKAAKPKAAKKKAAKKAAKPKPKKKKAKPKPKKKAAKKAAKPKPKKKKAAKKKAKRSTKTTRTKFGSCTRTSVVRRHDGPGGTRVSVSAKSQCPPHKYIDRKTKKTKTRAAASSRAMLQELGRLGAFR